MIFKNIQKAFGNSVTNNITSFLENAIVSIEGTSDRAKIKHFVLNMPAFDSKSLRTFINENEPGMDMRCEFVCKNCSQNNETKLPMTTEFFWPSK